MFVVLAVVVVFGVLPGLRWRFDFVLFIVGLLRWVWLRVIATAQYRFRFRVCIWFLWGIVALFRLLCFALLAFGLVMLPWLVGLRFVLICVACVSVGGWCLIRCDLGLTGMSI